jgi:hypothetical protein
MVWVLRSMKDRKGVCGSGVGDGQQTLSHGHLVRAIHAVGIDREEPLVRYQTEHFDLAVAVAGPDLVPYGKHPCRTHTAKVEGVAACFPGKVLWLAYFSHVGIRAVTGEGDLSLAGVGQQIEWSRSNGPEVEAPVR